MARTKSKKRLVGTWSTQQRREAMEQSREAARGPVDLPFLLLTLLLTAMGMVMVLSASFPSAYYENNGNGAYYFVRQGIFAVLGLAAMFGLSKMNYQRLRGVGRLLLWGSILLLVLVIVPGNPIAITENNATRWLGIRGTFLRFQPSELAKMAVVIYFSATISKKREKMQTWSQGIWPYVLILGVIALLMMREPHLSGTILIVCTGIATLIYTLLGGIAAVVWTDAIQGIILIVGAIACAAILTFTMPEGPGQLFEIASAHGKFSLGSFGASLTEPTFWVVLIYGLFVNMQNYGIDQNYVQRYMTTRSTAEAVKSTLFGGLLYIPVSLVFVYIGTALFSYYTARPELLPAGTPSDQVFPWFIVHGLPTGLTGLVIASLFSAGMSTIATSINSSATIVLTDFAKRLSKKELSEKKSMRVLYATSFVVGALGIVMGLLMMRIDGVLDAWWKLASIFSGGMLGLFLLGVVCKTVRRAHAVVAVILGLLTIAWMSLSPLINAGSPFYRFHSPLHTYLTIVFGTTVIFLTGFLLTKLTNRKAENA